MKEEQDLGWLVVALLLEMTEPQAKVPPCLAALVTATMRELPLHKLDKDSMIARTRQEGYEAEATRGRRG